MRPRAGALLFALAAFAAWAARIDSAEACEQPAAPSVVSGLLGMEGSVPVPSIELPGNVAFVFWAGRDRPVLLDDGEPVELELLGPAPTTGHAGLLGAPEPLQSGRTYDYDGVQFRVGAFVDEEAPAPPSVHDAELEVTEDSPGCGTSSCGERTVVLSADLRGASDDRTPTEHLTYALYLGSTAGAAKTAIEPERLSLLENGRAWYFADDAWADRDVYLSVAALDLAGNESERTDPIQIHTAPDGGCEITTAPRFSELAWIAAVLLGCGLRARRLA